MALTDPQKIKAARAICGMTQRELAELAQVGLNTIVTFEAGKHVPQTNNMLAIWRVFYERGIRFTDVSVSLDRSMARGPRGEGDNEHPSSSSN